MRARGICSSIWLVALAAAGLLAAAPRAASASPDAAPGGDPGGDPGAAPGEDGGADATTPSDATPVPGPPIGEVLAEAYRAAGLDRDPARGWLRRARVAGLVPQVTVRAGRNTSWQDLDPEVDRGAVLEVRATWRLDRLLFEGRELQVASIQAARRRERRQLASRVIRSYFHWRRMASAAAVHPGWAARAEEAAAELDALTDGWFGGELARVRPRSAGRSR